MKEGRKEGKVLLARGHPSILECSSPKLSSLFFLSNPNGKIRLQCLAARLASKVAAAAAAAHSQRLRSSFTNQIRGRGAVLAGVTALLCFLLDYAQAGGVSQERK